MSSALDVLAGVVSTPLRRSVVIVFRFSVKSACRIESFFDHNRFAYGDSFALETDSFRTAFIQLKSTPATWSSIAVSAIFFIYLPSPDLLSNSDRQNLTKYVNICS